VEYRTAVSKDVFLDLLVRDLVVTSQHLQKEKGEGRRGRRRLGRVGD
jgi:hypothetical protein